MRRNEVSANGYESEIKEKRDLHLRIEEFFNSSIFGFSTLPEVEIRETKYGYRMEVELHGLGENDVDVNIENNLLTIASLRQSKDFRRSFIIPRDVDREKVSIERGFRTLSLNFPKLLEECRAG
jgi:HSP20 family molecular chaperone IbpA